MLPLHTEAGPFAWKGRIYLCKERKCHFFARWSIHQCSPDRIPLCIHGCNCTCHRPLLSLRHYRLRYHGKASQILRHSLIREQCIVREIPSLPFSCTIVFTNSTEHWCALRMQRYIGPPGRYASVVFGPRERCFSLSSYCSPLTSWNWDHLVLRFPSLLQLIFAYRVLIDFRESLTDNVRSDGGAIRKFGKWKENDRHIAIQRRTRVY